ncbi:hypothetical protein [Kitasatospora aureofaciens]|uniref:hypothetical protein n=1 Tax=Kitasatospora aureofaciens TaxID=1894 RepID=UPI0036F491E7
MLKFAAAMPKMATEVQLDLIEQFHVFKDLGKADIDAVKEAHKSTLAASENSQEHFYRASQDQRDALRVDLGRDNLSWEQREALHDRLDRNVRQVYEKDSESKQFLGAGMKWVAAGGVAALALSMVPTTRTCTAWSRARSCPSTHPYGARRVRHRRAAVPRTGRRHAGLTGQTGSSPAERGPQVRADHRHRGDRHRLAPQHGDPGSTPRRRGCRSAAAPRA